MNLQLEKTTAKRLYPESPNWFKTVLTDTFGSDFFKKKDWMDIKTFEDACQELGLLNPKLVFSDDDDTDDIAYKKLKVITKAINQGWQPDWNNTNQRKWRPWFKLSSGFGFSFSYYDATYSHTHVGSRLCFESEEKSDYVAKQFLDIYEDFLTNK